MEEKEFPVAHICTATSVIVTKDPAYLLMAIIISDGSGQADAALYKGVNANAEKICSISAYNAGDRQYHYPPPGIPCPHGIYLEVVEYVQDLFVAYRRM